MKIKNLNYKTMVLPFFVRHQASQSRAAMIKSGIGGLLAIRMLCLAAFGATCILLFSLPKSSLSQPINVVAGHVVSTFVGIILHSFLPTEWWALGLAVGPIYSFLWL